MRSFFYHSMRETGRMAAAVSFGVLLSGMTGCADLGLPSGEPPAGDIVKNVPENAAPETPRARENRLATALIALALNRCPGAAWSLQCAPACREQGLRLMREVSETAGIRMVPEKTPGCYVLCGRLDRGEIAWSLIAPEGTCIWQEK